MYYFTTYASPVGEITIASDGDKLIGLWIKEQKYYGANIAKDMTKKEDLPVFDITRKWLDGYFEGKNPSISKLPISPIGGKFRQEVWSALCNIPYGKVITYGDIAKEVAKKMNKNSMSAQAIGGAVGHNPISIIIPCHRVVGTNGSLTGYAGGIENKIKLLKLEGVDISKFIIPVKGTAI